MVDFFAFLVCLGTFGAHLSGLGRPWDRLRRKGLGSLASLRKRWRSTTKRRGRKKGKIKEDETRQRKKKLPKHDYDKKTMHRHVQVLLIKRHPSPVLSLGTIASRCGIKLIFFVPQPFCFQPIQHSMHTSRSIPPHVQVRRTVPRVGYLP